MRGCEAEKGHIERTLSGFYLKYMSGIGLDIGYRGYVENPEPVVPNATGIDDGFPGYDGKRLPFEDQSQDFVFASHCLEHITDPYAAIAEWFRVVKVGGHLILLLPHQWLYEKKKTPPSRFCDDHKRFYTPSSLLLEVEMSIPFNSYRIVHMRDIDTGLNYDRNPEEPMDWWNERFEIELVLKRIKKPHWELT